MSEELYLDAELYLPSLDQGRLSWLGREFLGHPALDPERAIDLVALELDPAAYGRELYDALCPPGCALREGLREAILEAERTERRLRLRFHLSPDLPEWAHCLYWELLVDPDRRLALSRSPDTAFSRYSPVSRPLGLSVTGRPRLLCVISAPENIGKYGMAEIDGNEVRERLESLFGELGEEIEVSYLEPPATLARLRERLMTGGGFHLLHVFGHGVVERRGVSALVLEDERRQVRFVEEELLAETFLGERELRLVTLIACHGGASSSPDAWSGLAGRLVQRGIPAVIGMRRAVSVEKAHLFTNHLYRQVVETRRVDAAVNEARQQLYLEDPRGLEWSSPILYQRLSDGQLWHLPSEETEEAPDAPAPALPWVGFSPRRLRRPGLWLPALAWLLFLALRLVPTRSAEAELDLEVSRLSFRLAAASSVIDRFDLRELAAAGLARLDLPGLPSAADATGAESHRPGFLLAGEDEGSTITLGSPILPAAARVAFEAQGPRAFRFSIEDSKVKPRVAFEGVVKLKRLDRRAEQIRFTEPSSILLEPAGGALEMDLAFARLEGQRIASPISIDRLDLTAIEESHGTSATEFRIASAVRRGDVRLMANGGHHKLGPHDVVSLDSVAGVLTDLRFTEGGLHCGFRGRLVGLEIRPEGGKPFRLAPTWLDLWLTEDTQGTLAHLLAVAALATVLASVITLRPFPRRTLRPKVAFSTRSRS
jgi:hypothetical protein